MAIVTKTIGSGGDYSTIALWEADLDNVGVYTGGDRAVGVILNKQIVSSTITIDGGAGITLASRELTVTPSLRNLGYARPTTLNCAIEFTTSTGFQINVGGASAGNGTIISDIIMITSGKTFTSALFHIRVFVKHVDIFRNSMAIVDSGSSSNNSVALIEEGQTDIRVDHNLLIIDESVLPASDNAGVQAVILQSANAKVRHNTIFLNSVRNSGAGQGNIWGIRFAVGGSTSGRCVNNAVLYTSNPNNVIDHILLGGVTVASNNLELTDSVEIDPQFDRALSNDIFQPTIPVPCVATQSAVNGGLVNELGSEVDLGQRARDYAFVDQKTGVTEGNYESIGCAYVEPELIYGLQKTIGGGGDYSTIALWEADLDNVGVYTPSDKAVGVIISQQSIASQIVINGGTVVGLSEVILTAKDTFHNVTAKRITSEVDALVSITSTLFSTALISVGRDDLFLEDLVFGHKNLGGVNTTTIQFTGNRDNVVIRRNTFAEIVINQSLSQITLNLDQFGIHTNIQVHHNLFNYSASFSVVQTNSLTATQFSGASGSSNNIFHHNTIFFNSQSSGNNTCFTTGSGTSNHVALRNNVAVFSKKFGTHTFSDFGGSGIDVSASANNYSFGNNAPGVDSINLNVSTGETPSVVNGLLADIFDGFTTEVITFFPLADDTNPLAVGGLQNVLPLEQDISISCRNYTYIDLEENLVRDHESIGCVYLDPRYVYGVQFSIGTISRDYSTFTLLYADYTTFGTDAYIAVDKYKFVVAVYYNDTSYSPVSDSYLTIAPATQMRITVATGHRHVKGVGGVVLNNLGNPANGILRMDGVKVQVRWLSIELLFAGNTAAHHIFINNSAYTGAIVENVFCRVVSNRVSVGGAFMLVAGTSGGRVSNCVVTGNLSSGAGIDVASATVVNNCTVNGQSIGFKGVAGTSLRNCITVGNTIQQAGMTDIEYLLTSEATVFPNSFTQTAGDAIDLNTGEPIAGSKALKSGLDMTDTDKPGIEKDMLDQDRNSFTAWDMGAIQTALEPVGGSDASNFFMVL